MVIHRLARWPLAPILLSLVVGNLVGAGGLASAATPTRTVAPPYSRAVALVEGCGARPAGAADCEGTSVPDARKGTYTTSMRMTSPGGGTLPTAVGTTDTLGSSFDVEDQLSAGLTSVTYTAIFNHDCRSDPPAPPPFSSAQQVDTLFVSTGPGAEVVKEATIACGVPSHTLSVTLPNPPRGKVLISVSSRLRVQVEPGFTGTVLFTDAGNITVQRTATR